MYVHILQWERMDLLILTSLLYMSAALLITPQPPHPTPFFVVNSGLQARQTTSFQSICGYGNGDALAPWTADPGFDCRQDTKNLLWGFCPTTVFAATDCGFVGWCVDKASCSDGCGIHGQSSLNCGTLADLPYCFTARLLSQEQTYSYISCNRSPGPDTYLAVPTTTITSTPSTKASSSILSSSDPTSSSSPLSRDEQQSPTSAPTSSSTRNSIETNETGTSGIPAPSSASSETSGTSSTSPNNIGAIVGGVLGGLALIFLIVVGLIFLKRYAPSSSRSGNDQAPVTNLPNPATPAADIFGQHELYDSRRDPKELSGTDVAWAAWNRKMKGTSTLSSDGRTERAISYNNTYELDI